jgi:hypothetical protein
MTGNLQSQFDMKTSLSKTCLLVASLAALSAAQAGQVGNIREPESVESGDMPWSSLIQGFGIKTNDEYTEGNMFLTVPLWSTLGADGELGGDYLFIEPYVSVGSGGETAASLGIAWRHLFSDEPVSALEKKGMAGFLEEGWFIGASLFADSLTTTHDNDFWQLGIGAEIGTRYLEVRGNYYIPLTNEKLADRSVSTRSFSSSRTQYRTFGTGAGEPYATGNTIVQDVNLTTRAITTTRTTTVRTVTSIFEEGMEGWDVEASVLLPWVDQWADVRLIAGYYSFDNQPFGPQKFGTGNVHGWKAGLEIRPVPAVILSGMWYEDQRLTGDNWTVGLQFQIPLEKNWKDAFKPRRRHLVERLAEPVHRQNDAIKLGNRKDEKSTSNTSVKRVTRVVSQTQQRLVLADDIIFVNNGGAVGNGIQAGSAAGDGTAERPVDTIQTGADLAQAQSNATTRVWKVYTQGTPGGYSEEVYADAGSVNFIGSGRLIQGKGGKAFGRGPMPRLSGNFYAEGINFFGVTAYHIDGSSGTGIGGYNVARAVFDGNRITNPTGDGISIGGNGTTQMQVDMVNNIITNAQFYGVALGPEENSRVTARLTGNSITKVGLFAIGGVGYGNAKLDLEATGNRVDQADEVGVMLSSLDTSEITARISGNRITNSGLHAVSVRAIDSGKLTAFVGSNQLLNAREIVDASSTDTASVAVSVVGNLVQNAGTNFLRAETGITSTTTVKAIGNTLNTSTASGFQLETRDDSTLNYTLAGNRFTGVGEHAVTAEALHNSTLNLTANSNVMLSPDQSGFSVSTTNTANLTAALTGNRITSAGLHAFRAGSTLGSKIDFTATGNVVNGSTGGDHFMLQALGTSEIMARVNQNVIHGGTASKTAIRAQTQNSALLNLTANNNVIDSSVLQNGMTLQSLNATAGTGVTANLTGNTISGIDRFGIFLDGGNKALLDLTASDNVMKAFTGSVSSGFQANINDEAVVSATLTNNTLSNIKNGIHYNAFNSSTVNVTAQGNRISGANGIDGIEVVAAGSATATPTLIGNTIEGVQGNGITVRAEMSGNLLNAVVTGNVITDVQFMGINFSATQNSTMSGLFQGNEVTGGSTGIRAATTLTGVLTAAVNGNTITGQTNDGMVFDPQGVNSTITIDGTISNSVSGQGGLKLDSRNTPMGNAIINGVNIVLPADVP